MLGAGDPGDVGRVQPPSDWPLVRNLGGGGGGSDEA